MIHPPRRLGLAAASILVAAAASCVTVNIYFPAPEVRQAAEQIVDETWGPHQERRSQRGASILSLIASLLAPASAQAATPDVNVSTPAIRAIKDSIKARAPQLKPHMASGAVGIAKDGMLATRDLGGLDLAGKATVRRLVEAENRDRAQLYKEIAAANGFGSERVRDIQGIFAETWAAKAEAGWWVQDAAGSWRQR
ncbi:MAG TPA: YdbL family protein [Candidatus Binatia bacterium]|nr:YdbL family protein [Candidatus Binatia bacterium]